MARGKTQAQISAQWGRLQDSIVSRYNNLTLPFRQANSRYERVNEVANRYTMNIARAQGLGDNFTRINPNQVMTRAQYMGQGGGAGKGATAG